MKKQKDLFCLNTKHNYKILLKIFNKYIQLLCNEIFLLKTGSKPSETAPCLTVFITDIENGIPTALLVDVVS